MFLLYLLQADSQMSKDRQIFYDASLQYVFKIQEVQERKKFEFVEPVSSHNTSAIEISLFVTRNTMKSLSGICFLCRVYFLLWSVEGKPSHQCDIAGKY